MLSMRSDIHEPLWWSGHAAGSPFHKRLCSSWSCPDEPRWKLSPSARTCGGSLHLRWPNLHLEKSTETLTAHNTLRLALLMLTKQRDGPGLTCRQAGA